MLDSIQSNHIIKSWVARPTCPSCPRPSWLRGMSGSGDENGAGDAPLFFHFSCFFYSPLVFSPFPTEGASEERNKRHRVVNLPLINRVCTSQRSWARLLYFSPLARSFLALPDWLERQATLAKFVLQTHTISASTFQRCHAFLLVRWLASAELGYIGK